MAVSRSEPPTVRVMLVLFSVTPVTETDGVQTVTAQDAVLPPSTVVTVIAALPALTAVTVPLASTVAAAGLLDAQVTALLVAFEGVMVAVRRKASPMAKVKVLRSRLTPVTETVDGGEGFLVIVRVPFS